MKFSITSFAAAAVAVAFSATAAMSADTKTWYVYCEGVDQRGHWAVFSENFWPHPLTEGYGHRVGSAAKDFFEARHDVQLEGCAAVNFVEPSLAEHSRTRTAQLHRKMGDRVLYFPLPSEALPAEVPVVPAVLKVSAERAAPVVHTRRAAEPRQSMVPQSSER